MKHEREDAVVTQELGVSLRSEPASEYKLVLFAFWPSILVLLLLLLRPKLALRKMFCDVSWLMFVLKLSNVALAKWPNGPKPKLFCLRNWASISFRLLVLFVLAVDDIGLLMLPFCFVFILD